MASTLELRKFHVREASWATERNALSNIRRLVFIVEQQVPREEEWDGKDESAWHWLATDQDDVPIGTARLLPDGQIGRMAVLSDYRGHGVGAALLDQAVEKARLLGMKEAWLNAQTHALAFYERSGFVAEGEAFAEAGIPHRRMTRALAPLANDHQRYPASGEIPDVSIKAFDTAEVSWAERGKMIRKMREAVLVGEQGLSADLVTDAGDESAIHWVADDAEGQAVGAIRMNLDGEISRLVVQSEQRRQGIGFSLLEQAIAKAKRFGFSRLSIEAPQSLAPLFEKAGFEATGATAGTPDLTVFQLAVEPPTADIHPDPRRALAWGEEYDDAPYKLGQDDKLLLLRREDEFTRVVLEMARQAQRNLRIYSPMLDHRLYDSFELREICSALARRNRYTSIEILIYDAHRIIKNGHALLEISRKLSSSISIRVVHPDYRQLNHDFLLADGEGLIYRIDHEVYEGYANFNDVSETNRLGREFQTAWESSLNDPNLRQLKI